MERFGYSSVMQAPKIEKITLNMGVGDAKQDSKLLDAAAEQLATIAGQKPNVRRARKSIANFKLREGMPVGLSVTLRGERAYEFLDRLMSVAIPRIRDFRGLKPDARSTAAATTRWASASRSSSPRSTTTRSTRSAASTSPSRPRRQTDEEAFALLDALGMPFAREGTPRCASPDTDDTAEELAYHGQDVAARAPGAPREVQDPRVHPLPPLWPRRARCTASSASAGSACASWPTTATSPA